MHYIYLAAAAVRLDLVGELYGIYVHGSMGQASDILGTLSILTKRASYSNND